MKPRVIALLTDFGEVDYFVASLKGVILSLNPVVQIVDLCHQIPSFDIDAAGFVLAAAYKYFPEDTIFLAIVDPGVGSKRRILIVRTEKYFFVAPDNGLLNLVLDEEKILQMREATNPDYFLPPTGMTFEGRDKMAPLVAHLSLGRSLGSFGPQAKDVKKWEISRAQIQGNEIHGRILYADKFGNLITNIPAGLLEALTIHKGRQKLYLVRRGAKIGVFREYYSAAQKGEIFFLMGSLGLVEVASREASARDQFKLGPGDEIRITAGA